MDHENQVRTAGKRDKMQSSEKLHLQVKTISKETGEKTLSLALSDGLNTFDGESLEKFAEAAKITAGTEDVAQAYRVIFHLSKGMPQLQEGDGVNKLASLLAALQPSDQTEALLLGQFLVLQTSALLGLREAHSESRFDFFEKRCSLAGKLLNTANATMQTLFKYRSRGQQTVQVVHLYNEGQALVTQNISPFPGGGKKETIEPLGS